MDELAELARVHGVQCDFLDVLGRRQEASQETLLRTLQCLGVPIDRPEDAGRWLEETRRQADEGWLEPVSVLWQDDAPSIAIPKPAARGSQVACQLRLESGETTVFTARLNGRRGGHPMLRLPAPPPAGYHELRVELRTGESATTQLFVAPSQSFQGSRVHPAGAWGLFIPVYALYGDSSWGAGDFKDLDALIEWTCRQGGSLVATLPLLSSFFDEESDSSPYRPASRLFWNEFYLAIEDLPEYRASAEAQRFVQSPDLQACLATLRRQSAVDYRRVMAAKRRVLGFLAEQFFTTATPRRDAFERFRKSHPHLESYACFRAACEKLGRPWANWHAEARQGRLTSRDYDEANYRYHLFVQWLVDERLGQLAASSARAGARWYLDLPLGVHPDGYDTWHFRDAFAETASGGAPPDSCFTKGQCWGFPPLHPQRLRESGYRYLIQVIRHQLQHAGLLRIDHVMWLHRLYWIPQGLQAWEGAYVRYAAEEMYAILCIESHRYCARIIGENLGTVPPEVDTTMERRRLGKLFVAQYELNGKAPQPLENPPPDCVASLNTHDMPTFAGFWSGLDIADRVDLGLLGAEEEAAERGLRAAQRRGLARQLKAAGLLDAGVADPAAVCRALTIWLGQSDCEVALVNLEDLWQETHPQNTPGTVSERTNWRRKARYALEEIQRQPAVLELLEQLAAMRPAAAR